MRLERLASHGVEPDNLDRESVDCAWRATGAARSCCGDRYRNVERGRRVHNHRCGIDPALGVQGQPGIGGGDVPLNAQVQIEFSEPIDRTTVTAGSFALRDNTTFLTIPATPSVNVTGRIATLIPSQLLAVNRSYSVLLSQSGNVIRDASGNAMPFQIPSSFTTGFATDTTGPALALISPGSGATAVPLNADIVMQFSKPVNPVSQPLGVRVESNGLPLPGTFTFSAGNTILTFQPTSLLAGSSEYVVVLNGQLLDAAGNPLGNPGSFAFTTGATSDSAAPQLTASNPETGATGIGVNTVMRAVFNERIDPISVGSTGFAILVHAATGTTWPATVDIAADRESLTLTPTVPLLSNTQYTFRTGSIRDLAGHPGANLFASFTTGSGTDATAPAVTHIAPHDDATEVPVNSRVIVQMSEPIDPTSVAASLQLTPGVAGALTVSTDERTLTLVPTDPLTVNTTYTVALGGLRDRSGNTMSPFSSIFTTRAVITADTIAPTVTIIPAAGAVVAVTTPVVITVSEPIVASAVDFNSVRVFALVNGSNIQIPGTYTVNGTATEITFNPLTPYPGDTTITVHVNSTSTIRDLAGNNLTFTTRSFETLPVTDTTPPGVMAVMPVAGSLNVGLNTEVTLTFSEPLDPSTVGPTTFKLFAGTEQLGTSVLRSVDNRTVVLSAFLPPQALITAVATSGVTDLTGNALADFTSTFTTGPAVDTTTAQVVTLRPGNGATRVPATTSVALFVSEAVQAESVPNALWVAQNGTLVTGTVSVTGNGTAIQFVPTVPFVSGALVQVFLEGLLDIAGHTVSNFQASFTVANDPATTTGTVLRATPNGTEIPLNAIVEIEVSEPVDPDTVNAANVSLRSNFSQPVPATLSLREGNRIIRLVPTTSLAPNQSYSIHTLAGLLDAQGQPVAGSFASFATGTGLDEATPTVDAVTPLNGSTNLGINALVRVRFTEPVNPLTVTATTIQITAGAFVAVPASISFNPANTEVTITPLQPLPDATAMTIAVAGVEDCAGHAVTPGTTTFTTRTGADTRGPTLTGASVFSGQTDVPVNSIFISEFDELLDPQSVSSLSVFVRDNLLFQAVPATVSLQPDGRTIIVAPTTALAVNRSHSLLFGISGTLRDLAGNAATTAQLFFTTSFQSDATAPNVVATNPMNGDLAVPTNVILQVLFDEPVDVESLDAISLSTGSTLPVTTELSNGNRTVRISPAGLLMPGVSHSLAVVGVRDASGNQIAPFTITFTTGPGVDLVAPVVLSANPDFGATDVGINTVMRVVFNERIDPISLTTGLVRLVHSATGTVRPAVVSLAADRRSLSLTPTTPLLGGTQYAFQVFTLRDLAGNAGATSNVSFTTASGTDGTPPGVVQIRPTRRRDGSARQRPPRHPHERGDRPHDSRDGTAVDAGSPGADDVIDRRSDVDPGAQLAPCCEHDL